MSDEAELRRALEEVATRVERARAPLLQPVLETSAALDRRLDGARSRIAALRHALASMPRSASTRIWWALVLVFALWGPAVGRYENERPWWLPLAVPLLAAGLGRLAGRFR